MAKTSKYWSDRFIRLTNSLFRKSEEYYKELEREYERAILIIEKDIRDFYIRFAEHNEISMAEAKRILDNRELQEFKWTVDEYIAKGQKNVVDQLWIDELENASTRVRISRLQALEYQIRQQVELISASRLQGLTKLSEALIKEGYYKTIYEIHKGFGIGDALTALDNKLVESIISKPWAPDGANFSKRIWKDRKVLVDELQKELAQSFIRGDAPDTAIKNISRKMEVSKRSAGRLIMTESAFFAGESRARAFKELGVEEYQFIATLDNRTSDICQDMDLKVFRVSDKKVGVNWPPLHVYCRSTIIPHIEGNVKERWARDPETGKGYKVPGDMSYKDWYQKHVVDEYGEDYTEAMEKKIKNQASDKGQYDKYKEILGKDVPNSFDKFQDLKYNNREDYRLVKLDYSRRNRLIENPELKLPNINTATIDDRKFAEYLFGGIYERGLNKGNLITEKLGYDINNYKGFKTEILDKAKINPSSFGIKTKYGDKYETRAIFYSKDGKPINMEIGWLVDRDKTHMTSAYINEVKSNED